jgi:hypothetical protein
MLKSHMWSLHVYFSSHLCMLHVPPFPCFSFSDSTKTGRQFCNEY